MIRPAALLLLVSLPAHAFEAELAAASDSLARAEAALGAADAAEDRLAALSEAVLAYEEAGRALDLAGSAVAAEQRRHARAVRRKDQALAPILTALGRISAQSDPLFALGAGNPRNVVLAGVLLDGLGDRAAADIQALRSEMAELAALQDRGAALKDQAEKAQISLAGLREALIGESAAAADGLPDLSQDAANLAALAAALDGVPDPLAARGAPDQPMRPPVAGEVLRGFDVPDPEGARRPGLTVAVSPGALVSLPVSVRVRFAGELDSYGRVVILEPDPGVLFVIAGLGRVLVEAGQEPAAETGLGFLPGDHEDFLTQNADRDGDPAQQTLYMEVRVNGTPVDPGLWFAYAGKDEER